MRQRFYTPCRIEVEHSDVQLCAHVELAGGIEVGPGDTVRVHGDPIVLAFGERRVIERTATVERASVVGRWWTRFTAYFELTELYEVTFSDRVLK